MAARPPGLGVGGGADQRVARVLLPRAVERAAARGDHHVPGRRPRGAADRAEQIEPVAAAVDFGALRAEAFDLPFGGIMPRIVDVLDRPDHAQPIGGETHPVAARQEQPARSVLGHGVTRVDVIGQAERRGVGPRSVDAVRPRNEDVVGLGLDRDVEKIARAQLGQARRPDRADVARQRGTAGLPVHQIARVPDGQSGIGIEARKRQEVIRAVLEDRGIGVVAGQDRVEERAVAKVGDPLVVVSAPPAANWRGHCRHSCFARDWRCREPQRAKRRRFQRIAPPDGPPSDGPPPDSHGAASASITRARSSAPTRARVRARPRPACPRSCANRSRARRWRKHGVRPGSCARAAPRGAAASFPPG